MSNDDGILCDVTTAYGHYQVIDTTYGGRAARILYSDEHFAAQSGLARDDQSDLLFDYIQRFIELVRGLEPKRLLLIGGGAFTLPKTILEEYPNIGMDIVELDGGLLDIAKDYFDFVPSKNTHIHIMDGRSFLDTAAGPYDLIIIDAFIQTTIPKSLQTIEAAQQLYRLVAPSGVVAMNIISGYHGRRAAVLRRQVAGLQTQFDNLELFPAAHDLSLWTPQNFVLVARQGSHDIEQYMRFAPVSILDVSTDEAIIDDD